MKLELIGRSLHPRRSCSAHSHDKWELIYNTSGTGKSVVDGKIYLFAPGSVLLCPPGVSHYKVSDDVFEDYYLQIDGCPLCHQVYVLEDSWDKKILQLFQLLHSTYHEKMSPAVLDALLEAMMGILRPSLEQKQPGKYVQALQHSIICHYTDGDFSIQKAMREIPLNSDHLRRRFKAALGVTPHEYLLQLRIDHAKHLLRDDTTKEQSIGQIAYLSGFYDQLYFSRVFRKITGVPPSQWH